jgi:C_GCAxxG_C_C family probable redox protein
LAGSSRYNIKISDEILAAGSLFAHGMESGCSCGALVGAVMFLGILAKRYGYSGGPKLAERMNRDFKSSFSATCCRLIRKKNGMIQNIGNRACIDLTGKTVEMMIAVWEDNYGSETPDFRYCSDSE